MNEYLMRTEIIALSSFLIPALNTLLTSINADEPTDWAGRPVNPPKKRRLLDDGEAWGLLVEDMSCGNYLYLYPPANPRRRLGEDSEDEDIGMEDEDEGEIWKDMAMIEFKPKWLTQSPNAPANWKLCRTCAVRLMQTQKSRGRQAQQDEEHESEASEFCPLDLASGDPARIEKATFAIVNMDGAVMIADPTPSSDDDEEEADDESPPPPNINEQLATALSNSLVTLLTNFFRTSPIIPLMKQLQSRFGSRGVFTSATMQLMGENDVLPTEAELKRAGMATGEKYEPVIADEDDVWTAMTLRDCSLFLKVWVRKRRGRGMEAKIDCKIGDLDLKGGEGGRAVYWRDIERRLRMGGWYSGRGQSKNCRTGEE